ncbi:MAG: ubiquitin, partial [Clostridiales bacterium]|nr:ubiquitin [Clostridiales bacterium]
MDHFEMVEKLRQKANVSYEEAKAALEHSEWDLLDALVYLESQGK